MSSTLDHHLEADHHTLTDTPTVGAQTPVNADEQEKLNDLPLQDIEKALKPESTPSSARQISGLRWFLVCVTIYSTAFLYGLDTTIVADVQGPIVQTLGHLDLLTWIGSGFPLGSAAVILPVGVLYGIYDIKWVYIISIILFETGSVLCGAAPNMDTLIVGRVIAGMGGAGMYLGVLNYVAVFTTLHERPLYTSLIALVWGAGTILGPVIGGAFAVNEHATWRFAFYINLIIAGVSAPIFLFVIPSFQPQPGVSFWSKFKSLDWLGSLLIAATYTTWILVITFAGGLWAWNDGRTIATFVVFGVVLIALIVTQYYSVFTTAEKRIFPSQFLKNLNMLLLYISTAAISTGLFVPIYYIPLFFQFTHGDSALEAAVRLLPFMLLAVFFTMLNGVAMPRFGYYMPWYVLSGVSMLIGGSLMYTVDANTSASSVYGYSVLLAMGGGSATQAAYSVAAAKVAPKDVPAAIGFINIAQIAGIAIALTISGQIFQSVAFRNVAAALAGLNFTENDIRGALAGTESTIFNMISPDIRAKVIEGIVQAIAKSYTLVIAAGALTLIASIFLKREKLFMQMTAGG